MQNRVIQGDNLEVLKALPSSSVALIYIDPPFNTGRKQRRVAADATRTYSDSFDDFTAFLEPRLREAHRILKPDGSLYFHIDPRESHYCKILLDRIFGRDSFLNEIVWAYDYGGRSKTRWPAKHDVIFLYAKNPKRYTFNYDKLDRIPYMAPGLVGPEKAARGKTPTDVWWHTIVPTGGTEKTGYPTQKPLGILRRIVTASSKPGDHCMDFFAGSGSFGAATLEQGRRFTLIDQNPQAIAIMKKRFKGKDVSFEKGTDPKVDKSNN